MEINVPVLRKALEFITAHPEEWNQGAYAIRGWGCGSAHCLAGTIVVQQGYQIQWDEDEDTAEDCTNGERIADVASRELGFRSYDYFLDAQDEKCPGERYMFGPDNTLLDLYRMANRLTDGEIEIPTDLSGVGPVHPDDGGAR